MVKKSTYVLGMFPYPSGEGLHVGHVRIFTACDVMARYFRLKGQEVLSPMGWDAFGLPAENAAIKAKKIPQEMVPHNYANFKKQMQNLSLSFDWDREFATTDPSYYALTQWIFLKLYEKGLVYKENVAINWCPKCLTGLANEEVLGDGTHERCGTMVGKKLLPQWVMKITEYAERLLKDLDEPVFENNQAPKTNLPAGKAGNQTNSNDQNNKQSIDWPKGILEMQRNWIGKKVGAIVEFRIKNHEAWGETLSIFTTRIDTINGVTFIVVSAELAKQWLELGWNASEEVKKYIEETLNKSEQVRLEEEKLKTGVNTGLFAINPWNEEQVPIYVADYVLGNFGTGAVMGVPQYDERDKGFAEKYNLNIKDIPLDNYDEVFAKLEKEGRASKETTYHLRDWVFSRQRYWGEPIPLVYCEKDGVVPLPETQLPLELPILESYEPTETGESPLSRVDSWTKTTCPKCGGVARRETDTMPNWAGSCWYFLAYAFWTGENSNNQAPSTKQIINEYKKKSKTNKPYTDFWKEVAKPEIDKYLPVDWYLGGAEHAVLHLLYARFWVKVLQDLGLVDFPEPFLRLRSVGLVLAEDGKKMSKSLGNVVNPDDMVAKYGSDAVRMYEMFMGPWDQAIAWDSGSISGQVRFLARIKDTVEQKGKVGENTSPELAAKLKQLVEKVEQGVLEQKFNTAIAGMMEFVNMWRNEGMVLAKDHLEMFATMLSLFAPQTAGEIGHGDSWPDVSTIKDVKDLMVKIAVQVNGKLRTVLMVDGKTSMDKEKVVEIAMQDESIKKWAPPAGGGEVKKVVFVPGKLVNLVV